MHRYMVGVLMGATLLVAAYFLFIEGQLGRWEQERIPGTAISSIHGPQRLVAGEEGSWTVTVLGGKNLYKIDWGDGSTPAVDTTSEFISHVYKAPGRYPLSVGLGGEASKTTTYSYVEVVSPADSNACDAQYSAALEIGRSTSCRKGNWSLIICKSSGLFQQNLANPCMLNELQKNGWIVPKAL